MYNYYSYKYLKIIQTKMKKSQTTKLLIYQHSKSIQLKMPMEPISIPEKTQKTKINLTISTNNMSSNVNSLKLLSTPQKQEIEPEVIPFANDNLNKNSNMNNYMTQKTTVKTIKIKLDDLANKLVVGFYKKKINKFTMSKKYNEINNNEINNNEINNNEINNNEINNNEINNNENENTSLKILSFNKQNNNNNCENTINNNDYKDNNEYDDNYDSTDVDDNVGFLVQEYDRNHVDYNHHYDDDDYDDDDYDDEYVDWEERKKNSEQNNFKYGEFTNELQRIQHTNNQEFINDPSILPQLYLINQNN